MESAEKQTEIEMLTGCFKESVVALCAEYRGLTVAQVTTLRKKLHESGAKARVSRNTLARISAERVHEGAKKEELNKFVECLTGPNVLVFAKDDPVAPAKVLAEFAKGNNKLIIKGGWMEGAYVDTAGVTTLSTMPGKNETLAKLLALIAAPATQLVRLLQAPAQQTVQVLEGHRKNLETKGA